MNKDYFEHISEYISGKLSSDDRSHFERAMEEDAELKFAVDNYELLLKATEVESHHQYASLVKSIAEKANKPEAKVMSLTDRLRRIAASLLLLIMMGGTYSNLAFNSTRLIRMAHVPPTDLTMKSGDLGDPIENIENLLPSDPLNARQQANDLIQKNSTNNLLKKDLAHLFLNAKQYEDAEKWFEQLIDDPRFEEEAEYNRALSLIGMEDQSEANEVLEKISKDGNHAYQDEAFHLQNKLSSFWRNFVFVD